MIPFRIATLPAVRRPFLRAQHSSYCLRAAVPGTPLPDTPGLPQVSPVSPRDRASHRRLRSAKSCHRRADPAAWSQRTDAPPVASGQPRGIAGVESAARHYSGRRCASPVGGGCRPRRFGQRSDSAVRDSAYPSRPHVGNAMRRLRPPVTLQPRVSRIRRRGPRNRHAVTPGKPSFSP